MMWRRFYGILLCLVLCALYCFRVCAAEYTLTEEDYPPFVESDSGADSWLKQVPDDDIDFAQYQEIMSILYPELEEGDDLDVDDEADDSAEDVTTATGSNARAATPSNAQLVVFDTEITPYGSYTPYDSSISTTVVTYMSDVLPKLGNVHYVLFRNGQYAYRLVYADDLEYADGVFTAPAARYVAYDSRYYTWSTGDEGSFSLRANNYIVYSDLGEYPMLASESVNVLLLVFLGAVIFLFMIYRSLFSPGRVVL